MFDRIAFVNIGWSDTYSGERVKGRHGFLEGNQGHECCNFKPIQNRYYGYIPPAGRHYPNPRTMHGTSSRPSKCAPSTRPWPAIMPSSSSISTGLVNGILRAADLQQYDVDRQAATGDEARNIGNVGRHDIVGAPGKKPPSGAGAAQGGDREIRMTGGKAVAEGQRKEHAER